MATNWKVPTGKDLNKVLDQKIIDAAQANVGDSGTQPTPTVDIGAPLKTDAAVSLAVARIRGAIQSAGRQPLSVTAGAVPPEAEQHALVLAAWTLTGSNPPLSMMVVGPNGVYSPFKTLVDKAEKWLLEVFDGQSVVGPTDPTGQDYTTAITDTNLAISAANWGDTTGRAADFEAGTVVQVDMTTD